MAVMGQSRLAVTNVPLWCGGADGGQGCACVRTGGHTGTLHFPLNCEPKTALKSKVYSFLEKQKKKKKNRGIPPLLQVI